MLQLRRRCPNFSEEVISLVSFITLRYCLKYRAISTLLRESNMDDLACLKVVGILTVNFLFSVALSNYLTDEVGLIKSPVVSLKIFCSIYVLGYFILFFTNAHDFARVFPSHTQYRKVLCKRAKWNVVSKLLLVSFFLACVMRSLFSISGAFYHYLFFEVVYWSTWISLSSCSLWGCIFEVLP